MVRCRRMAVIADISRQWRLPNISLHSTAQEIYAFLSYLLDPKSSGSRISQSLQ